MHDEHLPHDLAAERAVIGAVFLRPSLWPVALDALAEDDFFYPGHRSVFLTMTNVHDSGAPLDPVVVADVMGTDLRRLKGGVDYLLDCAARGPVPENIGHYVRIVREKACARRLIHAGAAVMSRGIMHVAPDKLVAYLEAEIAAVRARLAPGDAR